MTTKLNAPSEVSEEVRIVVGSLDKLMQLRPRSSQNRVEQNVWVSGVCVCCEWKFLGIMILGNRGRVLCVCVWLSECKYQIIANISWTQSSTPERDRHTELYCLQN